LLLPPLLIYSLNGVIPVVPISDLLIRNAINTLPVLVRVFEPVFVDVL
jgi:hypothetical protein